MENDPNDTVNCNFLKINNAGWKLDLIVDFILAMDIKFKRFGEGLTPKDNKIYELSANQQLIVYEWSLISSIFLSNT